MLTRHLEAHRLFDTYTDKLWDRINAGRQWKDIRHLYAQDDE